MEIERTAKDIRNAGTAAAANNHVSACLHFNLVSNKKKRGVKNSRQRAEFDLCRRLGLH